MIKYKSNKKVSLKVYVITLKFNGHLNSLLEHLVWMHYEFKQLSKNVLVSMFNISTYNTIMYSVIFLVKSVKGGNRLYTSLPKHTYFDT